MKKKTTALLHLLLFCMQENERNEEEDDEEKVKVLVLVTVHKSCRFFILILSVHHCTHYLRSFFFSVLSFTVTRFLPFFNQLLCLCVCVVFFVVTVKDSDGVVTFLCVPFYFILFFTSYKFFFFFIVFVRFVHFVWIIFGSRRHFQGCVPHFAQYNIK